MLVYSKHCMCYSYEGITIHFSYLSLNFFEVISFKNNEHNLSGFSVRIACHGLHLAHHRLRLHMQPIQIFCPIIGKIADLWSKPQLLKKIWNGLPVEMQQYCSVGWGYWPEKTHFGGKTIFPRWRCIFFQHMVIRRDINHSRRDLLRTKDADAVMYMFICNYLK